MMVKDTDILQAVRAQDSENLEKLLHRQKNGKKILHGSKKLNINFQDEDGMSALHQAALQGNVDCMNLLLNNGAAADIKDNKGMRPIHYAAWQGLLQPVTILLLSGASTNEPSNDGETPLHFSCQHGHVEVVRLLLQYQGNPTLANNQYKTPLDLACEFGKYGVVQLLIQSGLCTTSLRDTTDISDHKDHTTCLHLASRNGHTDILRLLKDANVNLNRHTHQGTALHEAALYGKVEAVRFLIDSGIDVNAPNSYDQSALDIVNKFTKKAGAKELKNLLKEASNAVQARAVKSFSNSSDPHMLTFNTGDIITVIEQKADGIWKGYVMRDGKILQQGLFPSNCVAVMDRTTARPTSGSDKTWSSTLSETISSPRPNCQPTATDSCSNGGYHYPPPSPSYRANEMAVIPENHVSQCSRTSSASLDSRGNYQQPVNANVVVCNYSQRLSGQSYESRQSLDSSFSMRQSIHSNSSSSMGSLDKLDESGYAATSNINVAELHQQGMTDQDILYTWLSDLRFEVYVENFLQAGYDMPTISRMTPEDLTAIGITKPGHRKRLKRELSKLNIHDGIPDYKPTTVLEWLQLLNLDAYYETLHQQQYSTIESLADISWEDLEDIGITKLGHQKKIMLALERLKRLSRRQSQFSGTSSRSLDLVPAGAGPRWSAEMTGSYHLQLADKAPCRSTSGENLMASKSRESSPFSVAASKSVQEIMQMRNSTRVGQADIVPIQIRSNMSRSSSGNSMNSIGEYAVPRCHSFANTDRDLTPPASEDSGSSSGSMKRTRGPMKGIHGLTMSKHASQDSIDKPRNSMETISQYATLRRSNSRKQSTHSADYYTYGSTIHPPASPMSKSTGAASPGLGSLPSPFAHFRSPYAQIQSGQVKNSLTHGGSGELSSSVPSSPSSTSSGSRSQVRRPPPPPKRTNSIRRTVSESSGDDVFRQTEELTDSRLDVHEFPPPPPPIAFDLEAMKAHHPKNKSGSLKRTELNAALESKIVEKRTSLNKEGLTLQCVADSRLAARRRACSEEKAAAKAAAMKESTGCEQSNDILSQQILNETPRNSIESIPFANDNAGTIKQKAGQNKPSILDFADCGSETCESEDNESDFDFDTVKRMPKPVMHVQPVLSESSTKLPQVITPPKLISKEANTTSEKQEKDVLNDIGSMLENLTTELDAMMDSKS